jgi:hypothetical protein
VQGSGGAPQITVTAPGGETIASTPTGLARSAHMVVYSDPGASRTHVLIGKPPAGAYTIATQAGSVPIAAVRHADGLPAPSVRARLGGRGYRRTLRYTIKTIAGQKVRFLERAGGVGSGLGDARGRAGLLRFSPAEGPRAGARSSRWSSRTACLAARSSSLRMLRRRRVGLGGRRTFG